MAGESSRVWVVMEQLVEDDDGDSDVGLAAVHASHEGAKANLTPDGWCGSKGGPHERYIVEMEVLP